MELSERARLTEMLEIAKHRQRECMGGIDPLGCVEASRQIMQLRNALRDDAELLSHFAKLNKNAARSGY